MTTTFTVDEITTQYSKEDYKPSRPEPKANTWFEFKTSDARVKQHKDGYLTLSFKASAMAENGSTIFNQFVNVPLPVSLRGVGAPEYAKRMFRDTLRPLFPEFSPYDTVEKDPVTGKNVYLKDGAPLKGKAFDEAQEVANKQVCDLADEYAKAFVTAASDETDIPQLNDRRFYAQAKKNGNYTNLVKMRSGTPAEPVCYDRKQAFGGSKA